MTTEEQTTQASTLRSELETHRLRHRTRRMAFVISNLRERETAYQRRGRVPAPLYEAIAGFSTELSRDRARLRELERLSH